MNKTTTNMGAKVVREGVWINLITNKEQAPGGPLFPVWLLEHALRSKQAVKSQHTQDGGRSTPPINNKDGKASECFFIKD